MFGFRLTFNELSPPPAPPRGRESHPEGIFHFSLFTFHLKLYDFHTAVCMIFIQSAFSGEETDTTVKKDVVTLCQQNKKDS